MKWLREALFGNWRNKGVAMFFAVTIWFVAYQSEKQEWTEDFTVEFRPEDPRQMIITSLSTTSSRRGEGSERQFDGKIRMRLSGPRKLIAETRERFLSSRALPAFVVSPSRKSYQFSDADFDFVGRGLAMVSVTPSTVWITQDEAGEKTIKDLDAAGRLTVTSRREGYQIVAVRIEPQQVSVEGPASILDSVDVRLSFSMEFREEREGSIKVVPGFSDATVPAHVRAKVRVQPDSVKIKVTTEAQMKTLSLDGVRLSFLVRMPGVPFSIDSDVFDAVSGTIPVDLHGPQAQIERIEEFHKKNQLILSVPVQAIDRDKESIRTFAESDLLLLRAVGGQLQGFPDVEVRPHESRRDGDLWRYTIRPVTGKKEP